MSVLNGEGLLSAKLAKSQSKVLPSAGEKFVEANGSWLEKTQIESLLDEQHAWIAEEKTEKRSQLSEAVWNEDLSLAIVTRRTGNCWQSFGFQEGTNIYLRPEEALFLVETTCLELQYGGAPVSIQQSYELLFKSPKELQNYRVYRELMQVGYKARRSKEMKLRELQTSNISEGTGSENNNLGIDESNDRRGEIEGKSYVETDAVDSIDSSKAENEMSAAKGESSCTSVDKENGDLPSETSSSESDKSSKVDVSSDGFGPVSSRSRTVNKDANTTTAVDGNKENCIIADSSSGKGLPDEDEDYCMIIEDAAVKSSSKKVREIPTSPVRPKRPAKSETSSIAAKKSRPGSGFIPLEDFIDSDDECMIVDEIDSLSPSKPKQSETVEVRPTENQVQAGVLANSDVGKDIEQQRIVDQDLNGVQTQPVENQQNKMLRLNVSDLSPPVIKQVKYQNGVVSAEKEGSSTLVAESDTSAQISSKEQTVVQQVFEEVVDLNYKSAGQKSQEHNVSTTHSELPQVVQSSEIVTNSAVSEAQSGEPDVCIASGSNPTNTTPIDNCDELDCSEGYATKQAENLLNSTCKNKEPLAPSSEEIDEEADDSDDDIIFLSDSDQDVNIDSDEDIYDLESDLEDTPMSPEPSTSAPADRDTEDTEFEVVDLEDDQPNSTVDLDGCRPRPISIHSNKINEKTKRTLVITSDASKGQVLWTFGNKSGVGMSSALKACTQPTVFIPFGQSTKEFGTDDVVEVPVEKEEPEIVVLSDDDAEPAVTTSTSAQKDSADNETKPSKGRSSFRNRHYRNHEENSLDEDDGKVKEEKIEEQQTEGSQTKENEQGLYAPPRKRAFRWDESILWENVPKDMAEEGEALKRMKERLEVMPDSPKKVELLDKYEKQLYPFSKTVYEHYAEAKQTEVLLIKGTRSVRSPVKEEKTHLEIVKRIIGQNRQRKQSGQKHTGLYVPENDHYRWDESILWNNIPTRFKEEAEKLKRKKKILKHMPSGAEKTKLIDEYEALLYTFSRKIYEVYVNRKMKRKGIVKSPVNETVDDVGSEEAEDSEAEAIEEIIDLTAGDDERDRLLAMIPSVAGGSKIIIPIPSLEFLPRNVDPAFPFYTWENGKCTPSVLVDRIAQTTPARVEPTSSTENAVVPYIPPPVTPLQCTNSKLPGGYTVYSPSFSHRRFGINPWTENRWGAFQLHVFGRATPFGFQNFGPNHLPNTAQFQRYRSYFERPGFRGRNNRHQRRRSGDHDHRENRPLSSASSSNEERKEPVSEPEPVCGAEGTPSVVKAEPLDPSEASHSALPKVRGTASAISWKEYKQKVAAVVKQEPVTVKEESLVRPGDTESVGTVLNRIAVVKNVGKPTMSGSSKNVLKPSFDLFAPAVKYRKSETDHPNFRLAISREMNMPRGEDLQPFLSSCENTVRAVVAAPLSSVLYFEIAQVEIPMLSDDNS